MRIAFERFEMTKYSQSILLGSQRINKYLVYFLWAFGVAFGVLRLGLEFNRAYVRRRVNHLDSLLDCF